MYIAILTQGNTELGIKLTYHVCTVRSTHHLNLNT